MYDKRPQLSLYKRIALQPRIPVHALGNHDGENTAHNVGKKRCDSKFTLAFSQDRNSGAAALNLSEDSTLPYKIAQYRLPPRARYHCANVHERLRYNSLTILP